MARLAGLARLTGAALLALCTLGCGSLDTIVLSEERSVSLPEPVIHPELSEIPLSFEHVSTLPKSEVEPDAIDSVRLTRVEIVIPDPSKTRHFDFIEELRVYIQTPDTPSRMVATQGPLPPGSNVATLELRPTELREYLSRDDTQIRVQFLGKQPPEQMDVRVEADFLVDIKLNKFIF